MFEFWTTSEKVMMIEFRLNGEDVSIETDVETPLLYVLRNSFDLAGPKYGCGVGECGTCVVTLDGDAINSCEIPLSLVSGHDVTTVEGFRSDPILSKLRDAFIAEQAAQCAYCSAGILMKATSLIQEKPNATRTEIKEALVDQLCRCGAHTRVIRAIERIVSGETPNSQAPSGAFEMGDEIPEATIGDEHLAIASNGLVFLKVGRVELGQGVTTSLSQLAADALGVRLERVRVLKVDTAISPDEGLTSGSRSISEGGAAIEVSGLALRQRLLELCAKRLGVSSTDLNAEDGIVTSESGRTTTYWEVLGGADTLGQAAVWGTSVGTSVPRIDLPAKLSGASAFVQDLKLPGMLHGRVVRPENGGSTLEGVSIGRARQMPGVVDVVHSGQFLGVIAEEEHQAIKAAIAVRTDAAWSEQEAWTVPLELAERESETHYIETATDPNPAGSDLSATFTRPYLAHGSIGPSCAIALLEGENVTVWSHTQGAFNLRTDLAKALAVPEEQVRVIHVDGAGCYGHNGADDVALDAALLAVKVPGRPVRMQWSREDEFRWEPLGPAMTVRLEAGLDETGHILRWKHEVWSQTHTTRPGRSDLPWLRAAWEIEGPFEPPAPALLPQPAGGATRNALPLYEVGNLDVVAHLVTKTPIRTSALRSLGAHTNIYAIESFMDELATHAGKDPVGFRVEHLSDPRAVHVIERVVELSRFPAGGASKKDHGFGLGFGRYKNTACYVAVVAEVVAKRKVDVPKLWAVVDAGTIVNPDGVRNQIEGGILQSMSWALKEEIPLRGGYNTASRWSEYPILRFDEVPDLMVELVDRPDEPSAGVGEGAQGPTTAAIANGLRAVLGVSIRDLPFTPDNITKALL